MIFLNRLFRRMQWSTLLLCVTFPAWALDDPAAAVVSDMAARVSLGYRTFSTDQSPNRAATHTAFDSGPTGDLEFKYLGPSSRFMLLGTYLNDSDYLFEGDFDYKGLLRIDLASEKLFHNLDHFPQDDRPDASGMLSAGESFDVKFTSDRNSQDDYHVEVGIDQAHLKAKLPDYPAHLTLGYWRLERTGRKQLQYFNEHPSVAGNTETDFSCGVCHMESRSLEFERVTEEVTLGLDAHVGFFNFAVEQMFRNFREDASTPYDNFGSFPPISDPIEPNTVLYPGWAAGLYPHDNTPDSRLTATTLKVSTSPSGGLVAAAGLTFGKKENLSDLGPYIESIDAESDFIKGSADLTYTPHPRLTLNFRYRMLNQDSSIPAQLTLLQATPSVIDLRESIELERANYFAKASYRPMNSLTLMAEYERKDLHRSQTGPVSDETYWELPEDEAVDRYRVSFINRPIGLSKLRINGWYEILTSNDPAYGVSLENRQQFFAGVNWTPTKQFGLTSNIRFKDGSTSNFVRSENAFDRGQREETFTFGLWSQPLDAVSLSLNYGFVRSKISQDMVYVADLNELFDSNAEYRQRVHTATFTLTVRLTDKIKAIAEGRYVRSKAYFDPDFLPQDPGLGFIADSSDLRSLSELDIIQSGGVLGLDWELEHGWSCSAKFSHDDYEDRNSSTFDGTAQMYMLSVARAW